MALYEAAPFAVIHWPLDEVSGDRADLIGGNTLVDTNTVGSTTGKFSNCADFVAANQERLVISDNADVSAGNIDITFRCWVKFDTLSGVQVVCCKGGTGSNREFILYYSNGLKFSVGNGTSETEVFAQTLSAGVWYLVHCWHDAGSNLIGISVNGNSGTTASFSSTGVKDGTAQFVLGSARPGQSFDFDGQIDDFVILKNRLLTLAERQQDYNGGTGVAFADWVGSELGNGIDLEADHQWWLEDGSNTLLESAGSSGFQAAWARGSNVLIGV